MSRELGIGLVGAGRFGAFNWTRDTERTTIRLAFEHGHAMIDGWIPTRLEMDGNVAPDAVASLRDLFGDALQATNPKRTAGGVTVGVRAVATSPDRQDQYRLAVRSGMIDLMAAIEGTGPLRVTPADGLRSLEIAIRATL